MLDELGVAFVASARNKEELRAAWDKVAHMQRSLEVARLIGQLAARIPRSLRDQLNQEQEQEHATRE